MTARLVALSMFAIGCHGHAERAKASEAVPQAAPAVAFAPKVTSANVLAADDGKPPPLLIVIDAPAPLGPNEQIENLPVRVAAAPSWDVLGTAAAAAKPTDLDMADKLGREAAIEGIPPGKAIASMSDSAKLDAVEDPSTRTGHIYQDDPPPPPPDDDEGPGTGTQLALGDAPQPPHDKSPDMTTGAILFKDLVPHEDGTPTRLADVAGVVKLDGKLGPQHVAIVATPRTNARRLELALALTEGELVVAHDQTFRPLRIDFAHRRDSTLPQTDAHWIELRATKHGLAIEGVPDVPLDVADLAQLRGALDKARASYSLPATAPVDVLVTPDTDTQQLVDLLAALDAAGASVIGLGAAPDDTQAKRRGHRIPTLQLGRPLVQGDAHVKSIRDTVAAARPALLACYETALAKQPTLSGTVQAEFSIATTGKVTMGDVTGVDPDVAKCIEREIKTLVFEQPRGPAHVLYPLTMRP